MSALLAATAAQAERDADGIPVQLEEVAGRHHDGQPWIAMLALGADPDTWVAGAMAATRAHGGSLDAKTVGAHVAGQLGRAFAPLTAALGAGRLVDPSGAWVLPWVGTFDTVPALGLRGCPVAVAADDVDTGSADLVLADHDALQERFCALVVEPVLAPALAAVHRGSTFARRAGEALALEPLLTAYAQARRRRAEASWPDDVAALARRTGLARGLQPSFVSVTDGEHTGLITVGGACCRYDQWPQGERCDFCTLKPVEERVALWHEELAPSREPRADAKLTT